MLHVLFADDTYMPRPQSLITCRRTLTRPVEDLEMIRNQLRRFIEAEVTAKAEPWEEEGKVPRDVLRRMGDLGVLGMRYDEQYGGAGLDVAQ